MDLPQPPQDEELRNIIERLAVFVARNGQEFEAMTKQKQAGNPRFAFLFGGEFFNYYMCRVATEQAVLKHKANVGPRQPPPQFNNPGFQRPPFFPQGQQGPQNFHNFNENRNFERPSGNFDQRNFDLPPQTFDRGPGQNNFERQPSQQANFDRPPQQNFDRPPQKNFDRPPQQQNFDRPPQQQNFDRPPQQNFDRPPQQQNFDRPNQPQNFDRVPPPQQNFDRPNQNFDRPSQNFDRPNQNFNQGPQGNFDRPPIQNFDRPPLQQNFPPQQQNFPDRPFEPRNPQSKFDRPPFGFTGNFQPTGQFTPPPQLLQQTPQLGGFFEGQVNRFPFKQETPAPLGFQPPVMGGFSRQPPPEIKEKFDAQKAALVEQIKQSEDNLSAQQTALLSQQQLQIEDAIRAKEEGDLLKIANELNVDLSEFDKVLIPILESCTKDGISGGKAWIFTHSSTQQHYILITQHLLKRVTDPKATFNERLHIIYLVNDVLHHCGRKGANDLQCALESAVIPMFCFTKVAAGGREDEVSKLDKLLGLWSEKSNYVSTPGVEAMGRWQNTWLEYKKEQLTRHAILVSSIANSLSATFEGYQTQHKLFEQHVLSSLRQLDQQLEASMIANIIPPQVATIPLMPTSQLTPGPESSPQPSTHTGYPGQNPPEDMARNFPTPPPGDSIPALPFYELPAGLMVPLVRLEDDDYRPIEPADIRLPAAIPPSERLLSAVEAFYAPPTHERPRDSEGWERLGLYEYFKSKNLARKSKEDEIREGKRPKSRSPTPIKRESSPGARTSPPRRQYRSRSPTPPKRKRSRSPKRSRRRRSKSPARRSPSPGVSTAGFGMERKIDESNKGHQLLKKMGWGGSGGLGANEQGMEAPIQGGEMREKEQKYKGVGLSLHDPFESYRKSKGQAFVERMRARAEERL